MITKEIYTIKEAMQKCSVSTLEDLVKSLTYTLQQGRTLDYELDQDNDQVKVTVDYPIWGRYFYTESTTKMCTNEQLETLKAIIDIAKEHQLLEVQVGDVKIVLPQVKAKPLVPVSDEMVTIKTDPELTEEDILFHSSEGQDSIPWSPKCLMKTML